MTSGRKYRQEQLIQPWHCYSTFTTLDLQQREVDRRAPKTSGRYQQRSKRKEEEIVLGHLQSFFSPLPSSKSREATVCQDLKLMMIEDDGLSL
jgi:hypothetical protein